MKIAIVNNRDFTVWQFRQGLIRTLIGLGHEVLVATPPGPYVERIQGLGARHAAIPLQQYVDAPGDLRFLAALTRLYRQERIDLAHHITIKPNILGSFAATLAGVPRTVGLVAGLGHLYNDHPGWKPKVMRETASALYRLAFTLNRRVWFQNPDDLEYFVDHCILPRRKAVLIRGSGVNTDEYDPQKIAPDHIRSVRAELGVNPSTVMVLMASRAFWSKGVREFIAASSLVPTHLSVRFILAGASETAPDTAPPEYLRAHESARLQWVGFRPDIRDLLAAADVAALPSYYREGVPRFLLEALAMGKPIVTTDTPGCRETVDREVNGLLVPPRDPESLAGAITTLAANPDLRHAFGTHSRSLAVAEFDERIVVTRVLREVYELPV